MNLEIKPLPKAPRAVAQIGDVFTYTRPEEKFTVKGLIMCSGPNEYRMLNLATMRCGSISKRSADDLLMHYNNRNLKDFKHYSKDSWQAKLVLEESK